MHSRHEKPDEPRGLITSRRGVSSITSSAIAEQIIQPAHKLDAAIEVFQILYSM